MSCQNPHVIVELTVDANSGHQKVSSIDIYYYNSLHCCPHDAKPVQQSSNVMNEIKNIAEMVATGLPLVQFVYFKFSLKLIPSEFNLLAAITVPTAALNLRFALNFLN